MTRFLKRVVSSHKEEPWLVQIKVYEVEVFTTNNYEGIYLEWARGDKVEQSTKIGDIKNSVTKLICD
jgi:hypothetical protein